MENPSIADTVSEQAFQALRGDVLFGVHRPDAKLKIDTLQSLYGFSSSPLREALNRLTQEGLVNADERRGFKVAPISPADLADITKMRLMIDLPALRESIERGDDDWEASIVASFHRLSKIESRLPSGPVALDAQWSQNHRAFHRALIAACPSQRQLALSMSLFDQAERYRQFSARNRRVAKHKDAEHKALMKAALDRNADQAVALLAEHIESTQRNVLFAFSAEKQS
jgi:GntR family transcriptional regulator, carbon starvation induced regulator